MALSIVFRRGLSLLLVLLLLPVSHSVWLQGVTITPAELESGLESGLFDLLIDVRTRAEFFVGHIPNATNVPGLARSITPSKQLAGCEYCNLALYCQTGGLAAAAIRRLRLAGFKGTLYNGLGITQWTATLRPIVRTDSVEPNCNCTETEWQVCGDNEEYKCDGNTNFLGGDFGAGYTMRSDGILGTACVDRCVGENRVSFRKRTGWGCGPCPRNA